MADIRSAYIHIPFCSQMCHYCNFVKYFYNEELATGYVSAMEQEISIYLPEDGNKLETIYIGGGTPTSLNMEQLALLMETINKKFDTANLKEFTIEVNPGDIDDEKAKLLKASGVNRISFGVQVMDDDMLKQIGRNHRVEDVYRTVDLFARNDFSNISLDLIYSLPHQTAEQFERSLKEAMAFDLPHYSTYALQIEPRTVFYHKHKKGELHRPAEEEEVKMYDLLRESMHRAGAEQYEISNFAKPGYESKHNLTYWDNEYFYGFGAGASSYLPGKRVENVRALKTYITKSFDNEAPVKQIDEIKLKERIEEEMFLGLRKTKGYEREVFKRKFGFPLEVLFADQLDKLNRDGLLEADKDVLKLTDEGMLLANRVFSEFILEDDQLELAKP